MSSFVFKVASSDLALIDYTVPLTSINPIINATPSFSGLSNSVVDNGDGTTTITWTWTGFTDDGSTTDGLKIANNANFLLNIASLNITSFGQIQLSRASTSAFANFKGSITSSTLPTIATNTNFTSLFEVTDEELHIPSANFGNIGSWDVSGVINMSGMFYNCELFTQNISGWNTSACTDMSTMFRIDWYTGRTSVFNVDITSWNTSACTNMASMLYGNFIFNRDVSSWDVSNVTNMTYLFGFCRIFNYDISNWNTLACTNMSSMFQDCSAFNIQLETSLNHWTTENVTDMSLMFYNCSSFNKNLRFLNTSNVTDMSNMFASAIAFNQSVNSLDVSKVSNMSQMFKGASAFNQPIGWTSTSLLTNIGGMFSSGMNNETVSFNSPITFSMSTITNMGGLFNGANAFNQDISNWNTSACTDMSYMFANNTLFNKDISNWNTSACTDMSFMFKNATAYNKPFVATLNHWTTNAVTNMEDMFNGATAFNQDLSSWTTSAVTNMNNMFKNCTSYKFATIGSFDFTQLTQFNDFINTTGFTTALYSQFLIYLNGNATLPNGLNLGTVGKSRYTYTNDAYTNLTTVKGLTITDDNAIVQIPCFMEGTKIQCLDKETNTDVYVPIQTLKRGDLVKTYKHGYVALKLIGIRDIVNSGDAERSKERLYQCTSAAYPELFEDLFITGSHSILVDTLTADQQKQSIDIFDKIYKTDDKYRLPACIDDRSVPYNKAGTFPIYHIALENENYYYNYGVYANGLLVETCSLRYLQELSNMTLL
jgi:surface protein